MNWLPWQTETETFSSLANQQQETYLKDSCEACPGILLFRRNNVAGHSIDSYKEALIVLVVGEQPTGGINDDQWANAVHWLAQSASTQQNGSPRTLNILGPSFSGSFPSLDRELHDIYRSPDDPALLPFKAKFPSVAILSGNVSGCGPVRWFQDRWPDQNSDIPTLFRTFQQNDALTIFRFLSYITAQGMDARDTAILSEDETAYGQPSGDPGGQQGKASASATFLIRTTNVPSLFTIPGTSPPCAWLTSSNPSSPHRTPQRHSATRTLSFKRRNYRLHPGRLHQRCRPSPELHPDTGVEERNQFAQP